MPWSEWYWFGSSLPAKGGMKSIKIVSIETGERIRYQMLVPESTAAAATGALFDDLRCTKLTIASAQGKCWTDEAGVNKGGSTKTHEKHFCWESELFSHGEHASFAL